MLRLSISRPYAHLQSDDIDDHVREPGNRIRLDSRFWMDDGVCVCVRSHLLQMDVVVFEVRRYKCASRFLFFLIRPVF